MNCANHPDRERIAFCQDCGKPLCQECTRTVGQAVYCEESLAARLSGAGVPPPSSGEPRGTYTSSPTGGSYTYTGNAGGVDYTVSGAVPPPPPPGEPNPGLAALLGFIPGVGAMYNGQYAKGIVHLIVFAILVSLSNENGIFGLFVAGWICYQVIEAHHTARARRDGTPLPNPFGLNDLSERLGFGKSWPGTNSGTAPRPTPPPVDTAVPPTGTPYTPPTASYSGFQAQPGAQPSSNWNTPWESYAPPIPPYGSPLNPLDPSLANARNRFPSGAIWLIGLGALFLVGNSRIFHGFQIHHLVPFLLIGFGVWLFVHRMTDTGTLADDGTPAYRMRLFSALSGSVWILLVGLLFLLDSFDILSWGRSWPLFLLVAGLMAIFRRVSYSAYNPGPYSYPYNAPPAPTPPPAPSSSIVPSNSHDQEGK
jgi:B-box zinc finger